MLQREALAAQPQQGSAAGAKQRYMAARVNTLEARLASLEQGVKEIDPDAKLGGYVDFSRQRQAVIDAPDTYSAMLARLTHVSSRANQGDAASPAPDPDPARNASTAPAAAADPGPDAADTAPADPGPDNASPSQHRP